MPAFQSKTYWVDNICTKTSSLTLTFDHMIWNLKWNIYSLGTATAPKLANYYRNGVFRYWRDNIDKDLKYDLDLFPFDLKIEHILSRVNNCTKFSNTQAKGSKDNERTINPWSTDQPNDRQVQNNIQPQEGGIKNCRFFIKTLGHLRQAGKSSRFNL